MCDIEAVATLLRRDRQPIGELLKRLRVEIVRQTLVECGGNFSDAARELQVPRRTVRRWICRT